MDSAVVRARDLIEKWDAELQRELPQGAEIFDAHLHLGHDIDGMVGDYDELERVMMRYGISRAFMATRIPRPFQYPTGSDSR